MSVSESNLTPGEVLVAAREKASLSLEQIAESTRIAPNMLRAIELDEYHKIIGDLYVKSFLRSYAQAVGLEAEEIIELYQAYIGAVSGSKAGGQVKGWEEQDVKVTTVGLPWVWIVLAVIVLGGGGYFAFWLTGDKQDATSAGDNVSTPVVLAVSDSSSVAVQPDSSSQVSVASDTLAGGWLLETPRIEESRKTETDHSAENGKEYLPKALPGDSKLIFSGDHHWLFVVRLVCLDKGVFEVKRDAESQFVSADFPGENAQAEPLPADGIVPGKAYAAQEGFVVYWGADDHLSLRLKTIDGVAIQFNAVGQDMAKFGGGKEILLDSSSLAGPSGN